MFLKRIQVPDFRVLKDVDITFEPEFSPRIFPLGSLNGGGKSTLLQLIFILLTCSGDPDKHTFIQNMLYSFQIEGLSTKKLLATIYLSDNNQDTTLHFFCHTNKIIISQTNASESIKPFPGEQLKFSSLGHEKKVILDKISELETNIKLLQKFAQELESIIVIQDSEERYKVMRDLYSRPRKIYRGRYNFIDEFIEEIRFGGNISLYQLDQLLSKIEQVMEEEDNHLKQLLIKKEEKELESKKILHHLKNENMTYLCNYSGNNKNKEEYAVLYEVESLEKNVAKNLFSQISRKLFLAAPLTQVFLFLEKDKTKLLFRGDPEDKTSYHTTIEDTKKRLPNLFTYDILAVDLIIELIKSARDKDFKEAIESGEYGDAYTSILKELNSLLGNKKINIDSDLSGVNFKIDRDNETRKLYPEDLSHGELKRLSIYVWLKYKNMEDSIVLMDEIENAFHPDWQYEIISDLAEWSPTNQYILATHSYALCRALTPSHVKELDPELLPEK